MKAADMAQSEEHRFVTSAFIDTVYELSNSELYGYLEADRGGFDFACVLERDRSRPLVGQTLRSHSEGIGKDINFLLFAEESESPVYLFSDNARNVTRVRDTLHRASSSLPKRVELVRLYSYPGESDADDESQRRMMRELLREKIIDDLLMNVLFGRLTSADIAMFLSVATMPGLLLACLEEMAVGGMLNFADLADRLDSKSSTTRARVHSLWAAGMVQQLNGAVFYRLTQRARVFLKVCHLAASRTGWAAYWSARVITLSGLPSPLFPRDGSSRAPLLLCAASSRSIAAGWTGGTRLTG
ncbi:MAG: hypothetical protein GEV03_14290 [Streptosporangiales bacterium]|nr:hypothetical protein [Streptosporangiales bacterium]